MENEDTQKKIESLFASGILQYSIFHFVNDIISDIMFIKVFKTIHPISQTELNYYLMIKKSIFLKSHVRVVLNHLFAGEWLPTQFASDGTCAQVWKTARSSAQVTRSRPVQNWSRKRSKSRKRSVEKSQHPKRPFKLLDFYNNPCLNNQSGQHDTTIC